MRQWTVFLLVVVGTFMIDQGIKKIFLEGYYLEGTCIDLALHYNNGVAFSMFAFLGAYLKWIQVLLVAGIVFFIYKEGFISRFTFPSGLLIGGALGNLFDRFAHGSVVDYVAWHCGFNFAVFNYADVAIDLAVVWIVIAMYLSSKHQKTA